MKDHSSYTKIEGFCLPSWKIVMTSWAVPNPWPLLLELFRYKGLYSVIYSPCCIISVPRGGWDIIEFWHKPWNLYMSHFCNITHWWSFRHCQNISWMKNERKLTLSFGYILFLRKSFFGRTLAFCKHQSPFNPSPNIWRMSAMSEHP